MMTVKLLVHLFELNRVTFCTSARRVPPRSARSNHLPPLQRDRAATIDGPSSSLICATLSRKRNTAIALPAQADNHSHDLFGSLSRRTLFVSLLS